MQASQREEHGGFPLWKDTLLAAGRLGLTREKPPPDELGGVMDRMPVSLSKCRGPDPQWDGVWRRGPQDGLRALMEEEETSAGSRPRELSEKGASRGPESVGAWISGSQPPDGENWMCVV